jgi:succinate dehydrogenase/fumarate reductase flavoprotein subunit
VGRLLCAAALAREESRGAHSRTDFDATRDDLRVRFVAGG